MKRKREKKYQSNAEKMRAYRQRKKVKKAECKQNKNTKNASKDAMVIKKFKKNAEKLRKRREQIIAKKATFENHQPSTNSFSEGDIVTNNEWWVRWASSINRFKKYFRDNEFGHACSVCDRLWFKNDLVSLQNHQKHILTTWHSQENVPLPHEGYSVVCNTCKLSLNKGYVPKMATVNGFYYPDIPSKLPPLDPITERLISPRLPFMQVRRLRHNLCYGIMGQIINVPVDVNKMVQCLPRQLDEDCCININIQRNLAHKSVYLAGVICKKTIKLWLDALINSILYRLYNIQVDMRRLDSPTSMIPKVDELESQECIEKISTEQTPKSEIWEAKHESMIWNEDESLYIAPGCRAKPLNIIYDKYAEELSFPAIYYGQPRVFNSKVTVTPYMIASSEIRRRDRRGATPQKILYVAMKILRLRMVDGIYNTFRHLSVTKNVTRQMLEDKDFLEECLQKNFAYMKTVPNSVQYWGQRKRDLNAMIRQLGKPTTFLTVSPNETHWDHLLNLLMKLSKKHPGKVAKDLDYLQKCSLISEDPVTCCIYFHKLIEELMKLLKAKRLYNPFYPYYVKDFFLRIEFQQRGSAHAHVLLWLYDDPMESVCEDMPKTIEYFEKLSSVSRKDLPSDATYSNQVHKHTFTCTKRGEKSCRFGIPYWPMVSTRVLVPLSKTDGRRRNLQEKAKILRASIEEKKYSSIEEFWIVRILVICALKVI